MFEMPIQLDVMNEVANVENSLPPSPLIVQDDPVDGPQSDGESSNFLGDFFGMLFGGFGDGDEKGFNPLMLMMAAGGGGGGLLPMLMMSMMGGKDNA
jgi:hypothetical protein